MQVDYFATILWVTNYVIRHISKYSNITLLARALLLLLPTLVHKSRCKPRKPISLVAVLVLQSPDDTIECTGYYLSVKFTFQVLRK